MSNITIRPYKPSDTPKLITLFKQAVRTLTTRHYNREQIEAWAPEDMDETKWKEKNNVGKNVKDAPGARRIAPINDVNADMRFIQKRIGSNQHEMGTVKIVGHLGGPDVRCVKNPAGDNLINHYDGQRNDQPDKNSAGPFADRVETFQNRIQLHRNTLLLF